MKLLTLWLVEFLREHKTLPKITFPATRSAHSKLRSQTLLRFRLFLNVIPAAQLAAASRMFVSQCPRWRALFSPQTSSIVSPALYFTQYTKIIQKKRKSFDTEPETSSLPAEAPLSPQQLDRIARNKKAALERLTSAQTPPGFGESWKRGLSAEFGKPSFKQVRTLIPHTWLCDYVVFRRSSSGLLSSQLMTFVAEERKKHTVYPPAEHVFTWTQMCDIQDVGSILMPHFR